MKLSLKSIAQSIAIVAVTIVLTLSSTKQASAYPIAYEDAVNETADMLFYHLHRDLNGRKIRANEYQYIREWQALHDVVKQDVLVYEKQDPNSRGCQVSDWHYPSNPERNQSIDEKLADAVFFVRHPERGGRSIRPNETTAIREWNQIKKAMFDDTCV